MIYNITYFLFLIWLPFIRPSLSGVMIFWRIWTQKDLVFLMLLGSSSESTRLVVWSYFDNIQLTLFSEFYETWWNVDVIFWICQGCASLFLCLPFVKVPSGKGENRFAYGGDYKDSLLAMDVIRLVGWFCNNNYSWKRYIFFWQLWTAKLVGSCTPSGKKWPTTAALAPLQTSLAFSTQRIQRWTISTQIMQKWKKSSKRLQRWQIFNLKNTKMKHFPQKIQQWKF